MAAALPLSTRLKALGGAGGAAARPASAARSSASTTAWRVPSSSVKRRPPASSSRPPTPRSSSAASVFVCCPGRAGSTKPVGCSCTCAMSTSRAPRSRAIFRPSPVVCAPRVVGQSRSSGLCFSSRLSASVASWPNPPEAMTTDAASRATSEPLSSTVARQPAPPRLKPVHLARVRSRNRPGCWRAALSSTRPAAKVTSAPTKAFAGLRVRFAEWPPSCERRERSTPVRFLSQDTAAAESLASLLMRSGRAKAPALLVVSFTSDSTVVSSAALMPEDALPEFPPK
mmetsp:Transcript_84396/g.262533  ORF Transcript_84396/g.262533 Transcript_84396/m.262533 type:complete len:285 (+) Transcript_84396:407-1261(+)